MLCSSDSKRSRYWHQQVGPCHRCLVLPRCMMSPTASFIRYPHQLVGACHRCLVLPRCMMQPTTSFIRYQPQLVDACHGCLVIPRCMMSPTAKDLNSFEMEKKRTVFSLLNVKPKFQFKTLVLVNLF